MTSVGIQPLRRNTLGQEATVILREAIISGQLEPGTRLVEADLAQQFRVSRGPIRDALRELAQEGLIDHSSVGALVIGLDREGIRQIYSYRGLLEKFSLQHISEEVPENGFAELHEIQTRMRESAAADDASAFALADVDFHRWIVYRSQNRLVIQSWERMSQTVQTALRITDRRNRTSRILGHHEAILRAMENKDLATAERALDEHFDEACAILLEAIRRP